MKNIERRAYQILMKQIARNYGEEHQCYKLIEELNELKDEVNQYTLLHNNVVEVVSEIADVMVMLDQLIYLLDIDCDDVFKMMMFKVCRQIERIDGNGEVL